MTERLLSLEPALREAIKRALAQGRTVWLTRRYEHEGEAAVREYFLKPLDGRLRVGLDDYLERYEDATDLYFRYVRRSFAGLDAALAFTAEQLPVTVEDLRAALSATGRR
ncbi:hypothetical protein [Lysobacter sp. 1R34A]|uniref:hypothetical protein n=1 Tax=Lysobacter sp. 1R34A TaxID=3445786 RepID=UPI003EEEB233